MKGAHASGVAGTPTPYPVFTFEALGRGRALIGTLSLFPHRLITRCRPKETHPVWTYRSLERPTVQRRKRHRAFGHTSPYPVLIT